jgi:hypothetical protein
MFQYHKKPQPAAVQDAYGRQSVQVPLINRFFAFWLGSLIQNIEIRRYISFLVKNECLLVPQ